MSIRTIEGGVSVVEINGDVVTKKYPSDLCGYCRYCRYFISDVCFLSILGKNKQFYDSCNIKCKELSYQIPYLGEPIQQTDLYLGIFKKILLKVKILHDNRIVHCDLKFANILIDNDQNINIIDFSHSKLANHNLELPFCQTLQQTYCIMSPEAYNLKYMISSKVDIWSLGCVFYSLIIGKDLFELSPDIDDDDANEIYVIKQHTEKVHIEKIESNIKIPQYKYLLSCMLDFEPERRPTVDNILDFLDHKITSFDCYVNHKALKYFSGYSHVKNVSTAIALHTKIINKKNMKNVSKMLFRILLEPDLMDEGGEYVECIVKMCMQIDVRKLFNDWYDLSDVVVKV
jgi:serine/threonine protein kinase